MTIEKNVIHTEAAPTPIGPFSQAIGVGNLLFTSGQVGVDPKTGQLAGSTVELQVRQIFHNLRAVLSAAGTDLSKVVKTNVYLAHMSDFAEMNMFYAQEFSENYPSRTTVEVSRLPLDALVEIETIAHI